jgi:hypothetical protein
MAVPVLGITETEMTHDTNMAMAIVDELKHTLQQAAGNLPSKVLDRF